MDLGTLEIALLVGVAALTLLVGFICGVVYRKRIAEKKIGTAEAQAVKIVEDARRHQQENG